MRSSTPLQPTTKANPSSMSNEDPSVEPPWTILRTLQWTTGFFAERGIDSARTDAEILLADTLGCQRIDLYMHHDQPLLTEELSRFKKRIQRRAQREPVAYILGTKEFWSLDFHVTPDVLIPRPETEGVVEAALQLFQEDDPIRVLELGVGSGVITVSLAHERSAWQYWASDVSNSAIAVARSNARSHGLEDRIEWMVGNWFNGLAGGTGKRFDLILSNPPYVADADFNTLQPEVVQFEPRLALGGGPDGLDCIAHIIKTAPDHLKPGGWLILEIGYDQGSAVHELARNSAAYTDVFVDKDFSGLDRIARFRKSTA